MTFMSVIESLARADGAVNALQTAIVDFLKGINGRVPNALIRQIEFVKDEGKLRALLPIAARAKSFAEFETALGLDNQQSPSLKELKAAVGLLPEEDFERFHAWLETFASENNAGRWRR